MKVFASLIFLTGLTLGFNSLDWKKMKSDTSPPARLVHAMAYDPISKNTILYGGRLFGGGKGSDTWIWNGKDWKNVKQSEPGPLDGHEIAYCPSSQKIILFGGNGKDGISNETWSWNGSNWMQEPIKGPEKRWGHMMVTYSDKVLLFGGKTENDFLNDTWEWNGEQWTLLAKGGPLPRYGPRMGIYENNVILYGGRDHSGNWFRDTWEWDGKNWAQVDQASDSSPKMSSGHFMSNISATDLYLMGGILKGDSYNDIWKWNGNKWIKESLTAPFQLDFGASAYDTHKSAIIITGNSKNDAAIETWVLSNK